MNKHSFQTIVFSFLCLVSSALYAETLVVLPGESIQEQINAAESGDIIAIFGGNYSENLTIDKAVRLVELRDQEVTILGDINVNGVENPPPFEGLTFAGGKTFTFSDTVGPIILRECTFSNTGLNINPTSGAVNLIGGSSDSNIAIRDGADSAVIDDLTHTGGVIDSWTQTKIVNSKVFRVHSHSSSLSIFSSEVLQNNQNEWGVYAEPSNERLVIFRSTINGEIRSQGARAWIGYNTILGRIRLEGVTSVDGAPKGKSVIVANKIDSLDWGNERSAIGVDGRQWSTLITNNSIFRQRSNNNDSWQDACVFIYDNRFKQTIHNNLFHHSATRPSYTINVGGDASNGKVKVRNNLSFNYYGYFASVGFGGIVSNNIMVKRGSSSFLVGGAINDGTNLLWSDDSPEGKEIGIVDSNGNSFWGTAWVDVLAEQNVWEISENSSLFDAGSEDARYADRDGSRNNVGPSGGAWFDPDGWSTDKPVVFSFDINRDIVLESSNDTTIELTEGAAVSSPQ